MDARCIKCNAAFYMRNQRGSKLEHYTCKCGGKYERMNLTGRIYGESPNEDISKTEQPYPTWPDQRRYFNTHINRKGEHFLLDYKNEIYIPVAPIDNIIVQAKNKSGTGDDVCMSFFT